jgi:serine/threonine protein kinase
MHDGTRREVPEEGHDGTRRDDQAHPGTRREGSGPSNFVRGLPAELASRFTVVEELPTSGSEADVVLVDELSSGSRRVLKLYRRGIAPDEEALSRLALADRAHVVEVIDRGWAGGCWFEILEYCKFGSLRDLLEGGYVPRTDELVSEVATALIHVHEHGLVHRDLKPENLLVRTVVPFDLVLGDFGTVRAVDASVRWTRAWGTPQYSPPEFEGGEVSTAWDWWSCGMIVAEITAGHHPFELPGGVLLDDRQIRSAVAQRPVDLSDVSDPRTHLLCQGLLTRDRHHRWGGPQVTEWLEGGSPSVVADQVSTTTRRHRTVLFAGSENGSAVELAAAFQSNWTEASHRLFRERDPTLIDEVERLLRYEQLDEAVLLLSRPSGAAEVPRRFANLLAEMDPDLNPMYNGIRVTPAGLEASATHIIEAAGGDHDSAVILEEVRSQNILTSWRSLPGMTNATAVQDVWNTQAVQLQQAIESLSDNGYHPSESDWDLARAWVLACSVNPQHHQAFLENGFDALDTSESAETEWWNRLRSAYGNTIGTIVSILSRHDAETQTRQRRYNEQRDADRAKAEKIRQRALSQIESQRKDIEARLSRELGRSGWSGGGLGVIGIAVFFGAGTITNVHSHGRIGEAWLVAVIAAVAFVVLGRSLAKMRNVGIRNRVVSLREEIGDLEKRTQDMRLMGVEALLKSSGRPPDSDR